MRRAATAHLELHQALFRDVYKDVARIHELSRGGIVSGRICNLSANGKSRLVVVRGIGEGRPHEQGWIRLDEVTRDHLGLRYKESYHFQLNEAGWWQRLRWAWNASEPGSQIAAQLSIVSLILGGLAFVVTLPDLALHLRQFLVWICQLAG